MGDGGAAAELHAAVEPNIPVAELGAGGGLYFLEPNVILFEIATDGPGFVMDGPLETLGERHRPQLCASETSLSAPPIEAQMNQPACRRPYDRACA